MKIEGLYSPLMNLAVMGCANEKLDVNKAHRLQKKFTLSANHASDVNKGFDTLLSINKNPGLVVRKRRPQRPSGRSFRGPCMGGLGKSERRQEFESVA